MEHRVHAVACSDSLCISIICDVALMATLTHYTLYQIFPSYLLFSVSCHF